MPPRSRTSCASAPRAGTGRATRRDDARRRCRPRRWTRSRSRTPRGWPATMRRDERRDRRPAASGGTLARIRCAEVAGPGQVDRASAAAAANWATICCGHARLRRAGSGSRSSSRSAKTVPAIVRPDRAADLLEERQAARRHADPVGRDRVLDDEREDRERRPDAQAGDDHPEPQDRPVRVGVEVGQQEQPDARAAPATRTSGPCSGRSGRRSGPTAMALTISPPSSGRRL